LSVYKPKKTFSADGEVEKEIVLDAAATNSSDEDSYYNRQMVWLLRLKQ
jgi:hypothetical protein